MELFFIDVEGFLIAPVHAVDKAQAEHQPLKALLVRADLLQVALLAAHVALERGGVRPAAVVHQRRGRAADAEIIPPHPVDEIVPAFEARHGVVGNLVALQPRVRGHPVRVVVHLGQLVLVGQHLGMVVVTLVEGRVFLDDEAVEREMLHAQRQRLFQRFAEIRRLLPRQAVHQIKVDVFKPGRLCVAHRLLRVRPAMDAPERFQQRILRGLRADGQAVEPHGAKRRKRIRVHRAGVRLDADFRIARNVHVFVNFMHQFAQQRGRENGRRAAAKVDRLHVQPVRKLNLLFHSGHDRQPERFPVRKRNKITIGAFPPAERNVQIQPNAHYESSIFSTCMNASLGISTVPNWRMRFLPSFCFSSSFFLREISPP